ncbi:MAG: hypothetical protein JWN40_2188, partial [Phycisphaerales bacterium]|nr:hypothetical protein [Phycisphaerales bacterium]
RTSIAFVELLMLNSGFSAHDIDADVVAAFGLTAEQTRKIRGLLDGVHPNAAANPVNPIAPAEARRAVRAVLSAKQREILDEKIEAGLKAAGAKVPATRKSEASR